MVAIAEAEVDLFGAKIPDLEELKRLSSYVNSSEINKIAFADEVAKHLDNSLAAGIGLAILGRWAEAVKKLQEAADCREKLMYLGRRIGGWASLMRRWPVLTRRAGSVRIR